MLTLLPDGPGKAAWLKRDEKTLIAAELSARRHIAASRLLAGSCRSAAYYGLAIVYFGYSVGNYGVGLWLPQIVKGMGVSNLANGFVVALPYIAGPFAMICVGAAQRPQRRAHLACGAAGDADGGEPARRQPSATPIW